MDQKAAHEAFALETKIGELETDVKEIELVLSTLQKTERTRKCYRMVGGVLIERTAAEVEASLGQQRAQLQNAIAQLRKSATQEERQGPTPAKATA